MTDAMVFCEVKRRQVVLKSRLKRIGVIVLVLVVVLVALGWQPVNRVLHLGSGYAAKRLCSETFIAGRSPQEVWDLDLNLLPRQILSWSIDEEEKLAHTTALGIVKQTAAWRPGLGCSLTYGTSVEEVRAMGYDEPRKKLPVDQEWPAGESVSEELPAGVDGAALRAALDIAFQDPDPTKPLHTRAVVVVYDGKIVAERYAPGFTKDTPLLSWSMAKSVTNTLIGILVREGKLDIHKPAPVPEWSDESDPRHAITTDALLRMSSGLDFDETYGAFGDATKMLFVSKSTGDYAATRPLANKIGEHWYYSSGDTNLLTRMIRHLLGDDKVYHRFARDELFDKIGASTAIFETDPSGTFVGSSFIYMTARDWARFGQLYLQDGVWNGERILPEGWVDYSCKVTPNTPQGEYGAQFWLNRGEPADSANRRYPSAPSDLCAAHGFEAQWVAFVPSKKAVVVRLGMTRERGAFPRDKFYKAVFDALP